MDAGGRPVIGVIAAGRRRSSDAAAGPPFDPATLFADGSLGGWYDPSDLTSMWQDSGGTIAAQVDGPVGRQLDKSGSGHHRTQAADAARPTLRSDGTRTWLEYDGVDDTLTAAASYPLSPSLHVLLAMQYTAGASASYLPVAEHLVGSTNYFRIGVRSNAALAQASSRGAAIGKAIDTSGSAALSAGTAHVLSAKFVPGTNSFRVDSAAALTGANSWLDADMVAAARPSDGNGTQGLLSVHRDYGCILIDRALTAEDELSARQWLAGKCGVNL